MKSRRKKICHTCGDKGNGPRGKGLIQGGNGLWRCGRCIKKEWAEIMPRLVGLQTLFRNK